MNGLGAYLGINSDPQDAVTAAQAVVVEKEEGLKEAQRILGEAKNKLPPSTGTIPTSDGVSAGRRSRRGRKTRRGGKRKSRRSRK